MKILFITKKRSSYGHYSVASGLSNSAKFLVDMLNESGVEAKLADVTDNNDIDREVSGFRPDVVIIEAFWVVPEKFDVLVALYPTVQWVVRGHSDVPFLANEGMAIDWIARYLTHPNVSVAFNDPRTVRSIQDTLSGKVLFLPNYYPLSREFAVRTSNDCLNIGCFGAIRPLKNQLLQATAALRFANKINRPLRFHINVTRCEEGGSSVLKNLLALFKNSCHELVGHPWRSHDQFISLLESMDVEMAVSLSETFCITAADAVAAGVPLICSSEVPWASDISIVPANDGDAMVRKLEHLHPMLNHTLNHRNLRIYSQKSKHIWLGLYGNG